MVEMATGGDSPWRSKFRNQTETKWLQWKFHARHLQFYRREEILPAP